MYQYEYEEAKARLPFLEWRAKISFYNNSATKKNLCDFLESLITVKGHAWCMDVKKERKKMAKLISEAISIILKD